MCYYVRLSGGQHGFYDLSFSKAEQAAIELGAARASRLSANRLRCGFLVSTSWFNHLGEEIAQYNHGLASLMVFDTPRQVAPWYLEDRII